MQTNVYYLARTTSDLKTMFDLLNQNEVAIYEQIALNVNINDSIINLLIKKNNIEVFKKLVQNYKSFKWLDKIIEISQFDDSVMYMVLKSNKKLPQKLYNNIFYKIMDKFFTTELINMVFLISHSNFSKKHIEKICSNYLNNHKIPLKSKYKIINTLLIKDSSVEKIELVEKFFDYDNSNLYSNYHFWDCIELIIKNKKTSVSILDRIIDNCINENNTIREIVEHPNLEALQLIKLEKLGYNVKDHKNYKNVAELILSKIK